MNEFEKGLFSEPDVNYASFNAGYRKAIDDLREKLMQSGFIFTQHALNVFDEIAEHLK